MFGKSTFTQRFGEPTDFVFKGQVWDSRLADATPGDKRCAVCNRHIRLVFILKQVQTSDPMANPEIGKLEVGRCCFHYFRKWNAKLFEELQNALLYENHREAAIRRDKKLFAEWNAIKVRVRTWRSLRKQVAIRLRQLQQMEAVAPVAVIASSMQAASRQPAKHKRTANAVRWYDRQIQDLRQKIDELSIRERP